MDLYMCISGPGRGLDDPACLLILPAVLAGLLLNSNQVSPPRRGDLGTVGREKKEKKRYNDFFSVMAELSELWRCGAGSAACQPEGRCIGGGGGGGGRDY